MNNNELKHYGVLGMKWGIRKGEYSKTFTKASKKANKLQRKASKADNKAKKHEYKYKKICSFAFI